MRFSPVSILAITFVLLLSGCGTVTLTSTPEPKHTARVPHTSSALANEALRWVGSPYRYGGSSPSTGFDCSGLIYYAAKTVRGGRQPRTVAEQYAASRPINSEALQPGDLLFYRIKNAAVDHVGIYIGDYNFVHAPQTGGSVYIADMRRSYWMKRFAGARRL